MRNKLTSHSIESVGRQIRQKMETNHVWNRHGSVQDSGACKASSNTRVQMSLGHGSRSTVLDGWQVYCVDEGRRLLVSKDTEGKLMTIESPQSEVRRLLMPVKPMTQQGQCVCFGPDRAFAYKMDSGRVIPFESEAPKDANNKLQEIIDIMMTEKRLEQTEKIELMRGLPDVIKQMLTGRKVVSS